MMVHHSRSSKWHTHYGGLLMLLLASVILPSCNQGSNPPATVQFPATRSQKAFHCYFVLYSYIETINSGAGSSKFGKKVGKWVTSDEAEARDAAFREIDPQIQRRTFDEIQAAFQEIIDAFDFNSNGSIDLKGRTEERKEFHRHLDLCMKEFGADE
jgi:hypothetical protein